MHRAAKICATCAYFTTKDYPQQAEQGLGRCTAYDQGDNPEVSFVKWDDKFTVLYRPSQNMAARQSFIRKMQEKEQQQPKKGEEWHGQSATQ